MKISEILQSCKNFVWLQKKLQNPEKIIQNGEKMKIENLFIGVIAALVFYLFMQNFLGVAATKFIMQGLIIIAILCGVSWAGFQGYAIFQEKRLSIESMKIQIARNRYITHDTSDCLAIDTNMGDMQFFTNKRQPKPEKTIIEVPDESQVLIEDNTPMTALDYALDIDRAIVVGGTRSGKTYFCKQAAYRRIKERGDIIFAIDVKDYDPDDAWCEDVRTVGTGDDYYQIEQFWKWIIDEKKRRGQDMRRTKQEPNILILFDEINVTLYERPDFIAPYLAVLQKFAQYKIGIWAIGQADHKDGLGLPSVALKSNFGATFLFEGENGKHLKNYYRKNPDSCLTTPANSLLLPLYQPVRFEGIINHTTPRYTGFSECHRSTASHDFSSDAGGVSGVSGAGCMSIGMQDFSDLTDEESKVIRNYRKTGTLNKTIQSVWKSKNPTTLSKCKAILNKFGLL